MADFTPSKKYPTDFNKGVKYKPGDGVQSTTINNLIESVLWVQELAFSGATIFGDASYEVEVSETSPEWEEWGDGFWMFKVRQTSHTLKTVKTVVAERKTDDAYENMVYSYKIYLSNSVAVIVSQKIDMRVIIKGEK